MARLCPGRPPARRGARRRQRLGHRIPARCLAAAQPGHHQRDRDDPLREDPPGLAEGSGQALEPAEAGSWHRGKRRGRRSPGDHPPRCLPGIPAGHRQPARPARPPAPGTLPGRPARRIRRTAGPHPPPQRPERLLHRDPAARLGRHPARQHGHLPRGLAQAAPAPAARPRRADRGPAGDKRRPGLVGQPGLPADHRDPDPLRPAGRRRRQAPLQLHRHRRRRRPLPAVLQPQDETRGAGPHR